MVINRVADLLIPPTLTNDIEIEDKPSASGLFFIKILQCLFKLKCLVQTRSQALRWFQHNINKSGGASAGGEI